MNRRTMFSASLILAVLVLPATASADSGGATIRTLPESQELEVSLELHHECDGEPGCFWFGQATAYSATVGCPITADDSHSVWSGEVKSGEGASRATFAFNPYGLSSEVIVCLYVDEGSESTLVGESHPFNRSTGREVLPSSPATEGPVALWKPLSLKTAEVWVFFALEYNFKYRPRTSVASNCKREHTGRYRCNDSWSHDQYAFAGWVEVGKLDVYTGTYKYGLNVVRTEVPTHRRRTFSVAYGRAAYKAA